MRGGGGFCSPCNFVRGDSVQGDFFWGDFVRRGIMSVPLMKQAGKTITVIIKSMNLFTFRCTTNTYILGVPEEHTAHRHESRYTYCTFTDDYTFDLELSCMIKYKGSTCISFISAE